MKIVPKDEAPHEPIRSTWIFQWNPKVWGNDDYLGGKEPGDTDNW